MAATLAVAAAPTPSKSTETHSAQKSATCLFGLDSETWDAVLAGLVDAKFLSQTHKGMSAMACNTGVATGQLQKTASTAT